jgi:hypothetical protein
VAQHAWDDAIRLFRDAADLFLGIGQPGYAAQTSYYLARTHLLRGDRESALGALEEAAALVTPELLVGEPLAVAGVLDAVERSIGDADSLEAFCAQWRARFGGGSLARWYLEPAEREVAGQTLVLDDQFIDSLSPDWAWEDPLDDCVLRVQGGLYIQAANGRDLWHVNLSAPRVVRPVTGDWAFEATCEPASPERPAIGGILLWGDKRNYLRLDYGLSGERGVMLLGCLDNQDVVIGRGLLPIEAGSVVLRLERVDDQVSALCSAEGVSWLTVGDVAFPDGGSTHVGLYAVGHIDRMSYPGPYRKGTAIRFGSAQLWQI